MKGSEIAARAKYCMGTRKPRLAKKKCCATSVERSRSSRVHARRRHRLASSARRREKDGALATVSGGLERDEEAVDRNDEDVSLDAREPTIAYEGGAGLAMEVIAFSIHRAASSLRSGYAWVRPAAWRIHSTGRAMPNLARWVSCLLCREQFRGRWLLHVRLAGVDDKADAVQSSGVGVAREPGEELLVIAGGVAWCPLRGQRARHDQVGRLEADRVTGWSEQERIDDPLEPHVRRAVALQSLEEPPQALIHLGTTTVHHYRPPLPAPRPSTPPPKTAPSKSCCST